MENEGLKRKLVPMPVTEETIRDYGINEEDVVSRLIGDRWFQVVEIDSTEAVYKACVNPEVAEMKRDERAGRCTVRGKSGKLIRCPEINLCSDCSRESEVIHERNKPASLSEMVEHGKEPAAEGSFEEDIFVKVFLEEMLQMLSRVEQDYDKIFAMHYAGMSQEDIAEELGGDYTQRKISDILKEILEVLKPYAKDFFDR